jgi:hypothetical protein
MVVRVMPPLADISFFKMPVILLKKIPVIMA